MLTQADLKKWFCEEVLTLEPALMRFIRRHWRNSDEVHDIRQDVYVNALKGSAQCLPRNTRAYLFTIARHVIISRFRRAKIVSIELIENIESHYLECEWITPERHVHARQMLRRLQDGLNTLPPRCREIMWLRKVEGLSTREVASLLGIGIDAVQQQTMLGTRALIDFMLGGEGKIRRPARREAKSAESRS